MCSICIFSDAREGTIAMLIYYKMWSHDPQMRDDNEYILLHYDHITSRLQYYALYYCNCFLKYRYHRRF